MKQLLLPIIISVCIMSCREKPAGNSLNENNKMKQTIDTAEMTNNFYDNTVTNSLPQSKIMIDGEIANPGEVEFAGLPLRTVIVKEALLDSAGGDRFVGAYRYDGYSLFDILENKVLKKSNGSEFKPIIDMYVEVENDKGEKVTFSWGEIYYPVNLHKIIIATSVSRIVPSKTKDLWPLPVSSKVIVANDLVTERNISNPVKITVRSCNLSFQVRQGLSPMYSPKIRIFRSASMIGEIGDLNGNFNTEVFNTIFYGRGKGIHSTTPFTGILLRDVLGNFFPQDVNRLKSGLICLSGYDGYRCITTYSEVFNRNDQQEFLLIRTRPDEDGGLYRIFAASDFFSDRAIKSVSEIHLIE
jgi:hypothetical protein